MGSISKKIGVLGGGQLGKMLAQSAADWNIDISVLDPTPDCPASSCARQIVGDFKNYEDVLAFGKDKDIITIEIENVNLDALKKLQSKGKEIFPNPDSIQLIQDKGFQKLAYQKHNIPTSDFLLVANAEEVSLAIQTGKISFPFVQKLRKDGYDGKGVQIIHSAKNLNQLFDAPSVIESLVKIKKEIAVVAARSIHGDIKSYDPVEMVFHPTANLLLYQEAPSSISNAQKDKAKILAEHIINALNIVGLLAVEMFIDENDTILINEVAPRPHNSGHHTIETCITSQYQQHLRAILGLPLGDTSTLFPSALLNILGTEGYDGTAIYKGLDKCLAMPGVYIHLYGKQITKPFRKMGHVTITGHTMNEVTDKVKVVQAHLKVIA